MSGAVTVAGIVALLALVIIIAALIQSDRQMRDYWEWWNRMDAELEETLRELDEDDGKEQG